LHIDVVLSTLFSIYSSNALLSWTCSSVTDIERIFVILTFAVKCIFNHAFLLSLFFIRHLSLRHRPLLVTLIPILSIAMTIYSSLNSLISIIYFIQISNPSIYFTNCYKIWDGRYLSFSMTLCDSFGLPHCRWKNASWYNQVKEE